MAASGQVDIEQGVELADVFEQSDPATVVKRAKDGYTQGTSSATWASTMADAKPLRSSSAAPRGSIGRRRTLPGTSRPALGLTRAEVRCHLSPVPPRAQEIPGVSSCHGTYAFITRTVSGSQAFTV